LNLYDYLRNAPNLKLDIDGHCGDDSCLAQSANNDVSLLPHDLGTAAVGFAKQLSNIAIDTLHLASGGAVSGGNPINGQDEQVGANAANAAVAVVPALGEEGAAGTTLNRVASETETAVASASTSSAGTASGVGSGSKVDNIISSIDKGGFKVEPNLKSATQEANVKITHPNEPGAKLNLRSETHPLDNSRKPVPHVNVERVTPRTATEPRKVTNTHITD
jgi:hypothetical protein